MYSKIIILIGGKWFDKVNGNTYYNTKIIIIDAGNYDKIIDYSGFTYGYGCCYYDEVKKELERKYQGEKIKFVDGGCFYMNKREVIKGWF